MTIELRNGYATLPVESLTPASYNPNRLTDEQFAGLVEEVRRQGRVMKPIVVRAGADARFVPDDEGFPVFVEERADEGRYLIVDGEHNWRAAREVGLVEVPVQMVGASAFNARVQTYKRNLVGTNSKVRLGRMFVEMEVQLTADVLVRGGCGGRSLAKRLGISEGTVRNMRLYAKLADLCAEEMTEAQVDAMGIREVRARLDELDAIGADDGVSEKRKPAPDETHDLRALKAAWQKASEGAREEFLLWACASRSASLDAAVDRAEWRRLVDTITAEVGGSRVSAAHKLQAALRLQGKELWRAFLGHDAVKLDLTDADYLLVRRRWREVFNVPMAPSEAA